MCIRDSSRILGLASPWVANVRYSILHKVYCHILCVIPVASLGLYIYYFENKFVNTHTLPTLVIYVHVLMTAETVLNQLRYKYFNRTFSKFCQTFFAGEEYSNNGRTTSNKSEVIIRCNIQLLMFLLNFFEVAWVAVDFYLTGFDFRVITILLRQFVVSTITLQW